MVKKLLFNTVAAVSLLIVGATASASTFVGLTADELVSQAESVVQGSVLGVTSRWDKEGRIVISEARILVKESLHGRAASIVTVQTPGGTIGDLTVEAAGFPKFSKGQEVIVFLKPGIDGATKRVVGHQQGHFEVVTRLDGVTLAVPQLDEAATLVTPSGKSIPQPRSVEIQAFKNNLRAAAARAGKSAR